MFLMNNQYNVIANTVLKRALAAFVAWAFLFNSIVGWAQEEGLLSRMTRNVADPSRPADDDDLAPQLRSTLPEFKENYKIGCTILAHKAVNEYIAKHIPAGGIDELNPAPDNVPTSYNGRTEEQAIRIVSIPGLLKNTGQLAHVGLGRKNGMPVIYIDENYFYNDTVREYEKYKISKWESKRRELGKTYDEMRAWIKDPATVTSAKAFEKQLTFGAPDISNIYREIARSALLNLDSIWTLYFDPGLDEDDDDLNIGADIVARSLERDIDTIMQGADLYRITHVRLVIESFRRFLSGEEGYEYLFANIKSKAAKERTGSKHEYFNRLLELKRIYDSLNDKEKYAVILAVILHDNNFVQNVGFVEHWEASAKRVRQILNNYGIYDEDLIVNVRDIVRYHGYIGDMTSYAVFPDELRKFSPSFRAQIIVSSLADAWGKCTRIAPYVPDNIVSTRLFDEMIRNYREIDTATSSDCINHRLKYGLLPVAVALAKDGCELENREEQYLKRMFYSSPSSIINIWSSNIRNYAFVLFMRLRAADPGTDGLARIKKTYKLMLLFGHLCNLYLRTGAVKEGTILSLDFGAGAATDERCDKIIASLSQNGFWDMDDAEITESAVLRELERSGWKNVFGLELGFNGDKILFDPLDDQIGNEVINAQSAKNVQKKRIGLVAPVSLARYMKDLMGGANELNSGYVSVDLMIPEKGESVADFTQRVRENNYDMVIAALHGAQVEVPVAFEDFGCKTATVIFRPGEALKRNELGEYPSGAWEKRFNKDSEAILLGNATAGDYGKYVGKVSVIPHGFNNVVDSIDVDKHFDKGVIVGGRTLWSEMRRMQDVIDLVDAVQTIPGGEKFFGYIAGKFQAFEDIKTRQRYDEVEVLRGHPDCMYIAAADIEAKYNKTGGFNDYPSFKEWLYNKIVSHNKKVIIVEGDFSNKEVAALEAKLIDFTFELYHEILDNNRPKVEYSGAIHRRPGNNIAVVFKSGIGDDLANEGIPNVEVPYDQGGAEFATAAHAIVTLLNDTNKYNELRWQGLEKAKLLTMRHVAEMYVNLVRDGLKDVIADSEGPALFVDKNGIVRELTNAEHKILNPALGELAFSPENSAAVEHLSPENIERLVGKENYDQINARAPPLELAIHVIDDEELLNKLREKGDPQLAEEIAKGLITHAGTWRADLPGGKKGKVRVFNLFIPRSIYETLLNPQNEKELFLWRDHEVGHLRDREANITPTDAGIVAARKIWMLTKNVDSRQDLDKNDIFANKKVRNDASVGRVLLTKGDRPDPKETLFKSWREIRTLDQFGLKPVFLIWAIKKSFFFLEGIWRRLTGTVDENYLARDLAQYDRMIKEILPKADFLRSGATGVIGDKIRRNDFGKKPTNYLDACGGMGRAATAAADKFRYNRLNTYVVDMNDWAAIDNRGPLERVLDFVKGRKRINMPRGK
ncbi:MAG TPA: hypothetical protein PKG81_05015, partial [Candidatus Omnitrophota bacterium]|nr:hypothetical protein [Candidatus Omnitrophota bacterium]